MNKKTQKELLKELRQEDLTETVQMIAKIIGKEKLLELSYYVNGTEIYIPPPDTLLKNPRNRKLREEYNGYNAKELAKKYDLTEDYVKKLMRTFDPKQMSIFECFDKDGKLNGGFPQ